MGDFFYRLVNQLFDFFDLKRRLQNGLQRVPHWMAKRLQGFIATSIELNALVYLALIL